MSECGSFLLLREAGRDWRAAAFATLCSIFRR
jgi:hypothetical protein